jgi:hypothetical protein
MASPTKTRQRPKRLQKSALPRPIFVPRPPEPTYPMDVATRSMTRLECVMPAGIPSREPRTRPLDSTPRRSCRGRRFVALQPPPK